MNISYRLYDVIADQTDSESFETLADALAAKGNCKHLAVEKQQHTDKCRFGGGDVAGACTSKTVVRADESAYARARALGRDDSAV